MSSYYDDPDFADEYRARDDEALDWAIREREEQERSQSQILKNTHVPSDPRCVQYRSRTPIKGRCPMCNPVLQIPRSAR